MRLGHLPRALFPLLVACVLHPQRAFVSSTCARLLRPGDASSAYSDRTFRRLQAASAGVAECDSSRVDLLFLVDASGSIQAQNFAYARQFIESVASAFDMSAGQARMGVTTFATAVTNHIQLPHTPATVTSSPALGFFLMTPPRRSHLMGSAPPLSSSLSGAALVRRQPLE